MMEKLDRDEIIRELESFRTFYNSRWDMALNAYEENILEEIIEWIRHPRLAREVSRPNA
jgi:hypothetical protein